MKRVKITKYELNQIKIQQSKRNGENYKEDREAHWLEAAQELVKMKHLQTKLISKEYMMMTKAVRTNLMKTKFRAFIYRLLWNFFYQYLGLNTSMTCPTLSLTPLFFSSTKYFNDVLSALSLSQMKLFVEWLFGRKVFCEITLKRSCSAHDHFPSQLTVLWNCHACGRHKVLVSQETYWWK